MNEKVTFKPRRLQRHQQAQAHNSTLADEPSIVSSKF
jgi:hypothetical protein